MTADTMRFLAANVLILTCLAPEEVIDRARRMRSTVRLLGVLTIAFLLASDPALAQTTNLAVSHVGANPSRVALRWRKSGEVGEWIPGMSADEIETMLAGVDWDAMFGSSSFEFKNGRRKRHARGYPSHLEFGLNHGIKGPTALNSGQHVELMIGRITTSSYALSFDELPTPFHAMAVDLRTAKFIVLDHGPLVTAMRATMSLPLIFPRSSSRDTCWSTAG